MRLIDADALIAQMEADAEQMEDQIVIMVTYAAINDVKHAPTIEERKTGKWIVCTERVEETFHTGSRCSVCNYWKPMGIWNFCPNCGSYNKGETNE